MLTKEDFEGLTYKYIIHCHVGTRYAHGSFDRVSDTTLVLRRCRVYDKYLSPSPLVSAVYSEELKIPLSKIEIFHFKRNPI